ncbi:MAG: hypothetical protein M1826_004131 [Phylliscum demangeonii]|nr:MAG: hypothetical protein M1826_004131 [Phylliscum demangeonii]
MSGFKEKLKMQRQDFKGFNQVAGWVGKGKPASPSPQAHRSTPLAALPDPASFAPPPKNINYHGPSAVSPTTSPARSTPAFSTAQVSAPEEHDEPRPRPPLLPSRSKTATSIPTNVSQLAPDKSRPAVPPRLPPRPTLDGGQEQSTSVRTPPLESGSTSSRAGQLNQAALARLGRAGITVPAFGIGGSPKPAEAEERTSSSDESHPVAKRPSTFSTLSTGSADAGHGSQGTTWAQKQAALRTATNFHQDPSSISFSDARAAVSTANSFQQRHGAQLAQGVRAGKALSDRISAPSEPGVKKATLEDEVADAAVKPNLGAGLSSAKQAPPARPIKKPELSGDPARSVEPPPVPLASKPR